MATLENDSAPQFMDSNQYDQGFVDYGNQPEVDFSSSAPPPLPPKIMQRNQLLMTMMRMQLNQLWMNQF